MIVRLLIAFIFCFVASMFDGRSQEVLEDLRYNQALQSQATESNDASREVIRKPFIYAIDTIDLPFFDDFTKNRIKTYNANKDGNNISLKVIFGFTVNGDHPTKLSIKREPTFSVLKPISGPPQYEENPVLYVTFYDAEGEEIAYDTGWTNIITEFNQSSGLVTYDTIEAETTFVNTFDTLYVVDDDNSLWITPTNEARRGGAFINNSFAINPITQGVATFDGADSRGFPYDITSETAQGPADTLESKPIALDAAMQNIFLSFFYQAGGHGNEPEEEDTLVLEFYDVTNDLWRHVWSRSGGLDEPDEWSEQVWIRVLGPDYQQPGFKFRFRNYATLSASMDHWNIDYVRLGSERDSIAEDTISDVAFVSSLSSFTGLYTSVPYKHYLESFDSFQEDTVFASIRNLGYSDVNVLTLEFRVTDPSNSLVQSFSTSDPNLAASSTKNYGFLQPATQIFPDLGTEIGIFDIKTWFSISGGNDQFENDTVYSKQEFYNYYAYDDGSAEKAYALTGAGLKLAYEYYTHVGDSLQAVLINFPMTLKNNAEDLGIEIMIWEDTNSAPIYESTFIETPRYTSSNEFARYDLEFPVYVEGKYYIGFRQIESDKIYIGFDVNTATNNRILYNSGERWYQSSFKGSLLMRPDFGEDLSLDVAPVDSPEWSVSIYPNPAKSQFFVSSKNESIDVQIFSLSGSLLASLRVDSNQSVSTQDLSAGVYIVRLSGVKSKETVVSKLIIAQ